jgi:TM2 domain-containing membrane protein YozV
MQQQFQCPNCKATVPVGDSFCAKCGTKLAWPTPQAAVVQPSAIAQNVESVSPKSRLVVTLLAFFLGELGVHRFYVEKIGTGLLMLFTLGGFGIWALIDFIMAVAGIMKDKDGKPITRW